MRSPLLRVAMMLPVMLLIVGLVRTFNAQFPILGDDFDVASHVQALILTTAWSMAGGRLYAIWLFAPLRRELRRQSAELERRIKELEAMER